MEEWLSHAVHATLEARSHFNVSLNSSSVRENQWGSENSTRAVIASLQLAQVQTLRTMHLGLGAFSLALTLLMVHRIFSDARRAASLQVTLRKQRFNSLQNVHPAETFPLALGCGAVLSQIIFVTVQGTALYSVLSTNCRVQAMATLPAMFIMGYITLVFGVETAYRSFKPQRFEARGKWNTIVCIGIVAFMFVVTWIPTIAWPMFNRCFGSLIWFPMRYDLLIFILLVLLVSFLLLLAAIISIQLMKAEDVDANERIAASRMCYYLLLIAVIYILVIPVEAQSLQKSFTSALGGARFAEASLFASGIVISFFHLFLRTNANRLVLRPINQMKAQPQEQRPKLRFFGPSDLEMNISGPLSLEGTPRTDSRHGLIDVGPEKNRSDFDSRYFERPERALTPSSAKSRSPIDLTKWPLPPDVDDPEDTGRRGRKASYSIFPTRAEDVPRLPATVYNPSKVYKSESRISKLAMRRFNRRSSVTDVSREFETLDKPNAFLSMGKSRHASTASSATVQIGLRFSLAPAMAAGRSSNSPNMSPSVSPTAPYLPQYNRSDTDSSGESLSLPLQAPSPSGELLQPATFSPHSQKAVTPTKPSPARTPAFPLTPSIHCSAYLQAQREKVLPIAQATAPLPVAQATASLPVTQAKVTVPTPAVLSGLRMNPVSPAASIASSPSSPRPMTPVQLTVVRSNSGRSATSPSPTARIPMGAGTMSRTPPPQGWL